MNELNNMKQLEELIIGVPSKKISNHDINEYLCDIKELVNINLDKHFFTKIKLLQWFVTNCTIDRNGDLITKMYFKYRSSSFL